MQRRLLFFFLAASCLAAAMGQGKSRLSYLAATPEWRMLDRYQHTITRAECAGLLKLFSPDSHVFDFLDFYMDRAVVYANRGKTTRLWELQFAKNAASRALWRPDFPANKARLLLGATAAKPLSGLTICLDPGHIGGKWARIEERSFAIQQNAPRVQEGDLTWTTAKLLEERLLKAGARIVWTRGEGEPATSKRPKDFLPEAVEMFAQGDPKRVASALRSSDDLRLEVLRRQHLLFYRIEEIAARAERVKTASPDLTVCLHYNAAPWRRRRPRLYSVNKTVVFVHGSYMPAELEFEDQLYLLFDKLLARNSEREIEAAEAIGKWLANIWSHPPERYDDKDGIHPASSNPYVWSRNLLANRLYPGPVVFVEGPYMNDQTTYYRLLKGDYLGERVIEGKLYRSIFREYADIIAGALIEYFSRGLFD
jgi:N-acetylmuramoyl-L-alanine amidase